MIAILDYEAGNQTSVRRALDHLDIECTITADPQCMAQAAGVIFPGVGAAGQAMAHLRATGLDRLLADIVHRGTPLLGICLGCQILLAHSVENNTSTLGLLPGECRRFDLAATPCETDGTPLRIPHMGWNTLHLQRESPLFAHIPATAHYYFVHSYYVYTEPELVIATCDYGQTFCAAYGRDGLWGVQFHPEKSGEPGLQVLKNFHAYCVQAKQTEQAPTTADTPC